MQIVNVISMKYFLDSDIISFLLRGRNKKLSEKIYSTNARDLCTTTLNYAEVLGGIAHSSGIHSKRYKLYSNFFEYVRLYTVEKPTVDIYIQLFEYLSNEGKRIGTTDTLIASICIQRKGILVTNNIKHFERLERFGLKIENWAE